MNAGFFSSKPVKKDKIWMSVELVAKSCHQLKRGSFFGGILTKFYCANPYLVDLHSNLLSANLPAHQIIILIQLNG